MIDRNATGFHKLTSNSHLVVIRLDFDAGRNMLHNLNTLTGSSVIAMDGEWGNSGREQSGTVEQWTA